MEKIKRKAYLDFLWIIAVVIFVLCLTYGFIFVTSAKSDSEIEFINRNLH